MLPPRLSKRLTGWAARKAAHRQAERRHVREDAPASLASCMLRTLAALRPPAPHDRALSTRSRRSSTAGWPRSPRRRARDLGLALEIALCGRLIKGYGDTTAAPRPTSCASSTRSCTADSFALRRGARVGDAARRARRALADPEGRKLEQSLEARRHRAAAAAAEAAHVLAPARRAARSARPDPWKSRFRDEIEHAQARRRRGLPRRRHPRGDEGAAAVGRRLRRRLPGRAGVAPARRHGAGARLPRRTRRARRGVHQRSLGRRDARAPRSTTRCAAP